MQSPQDPTRDPPLVHSESQGQRSETSKQEVEGFHLQLCSQQQRQSRLPHIWSEREASDAHLWALRSCHVAAGRRPLVVCAYVCVCVGLFVSPLETCLRRSVGSLGSVCPSTTTTSRSVHNIAGIIPTLGGAADASLCFFSCTLPSRSPPLSSLPLSAGQTAAFHLSLRRSVSQPICRSCDRPSPTPPAPFNWDTTFPKPPRYTLNSISVRYGS